MGAEPNHGRGSVISMRVVISANFLEHDVIFLLDEVLSTARLGNPLEEFHLLGA
jgi:hypothetical protein